MPAPPRVFAPSATGPWSLTRNFSPPVPSPLGAAFPDGREAVKGAGRAAGERRVAPSARGRQPRRRSRRAPSARAASSIGPAAGRGTMLVPSE